MGVQALILAAGRGSRLGKLTENLPKPLLQVGSKRLVHRQLEMLSEASVGPVGMVLGYRAGQIVDEVGSQAEYIYNHHWETTNSLFSFVQARDWVYEDLLLMNCDLLLHPKICDQLLDAGPDSFAYDSTSGDAREHMKVNLESGHLNEMSKQLPNPRISGENVGMLYFSAATAQRLFEIGYELIEAGHTTDWVGIAVQRLAKEVPLKGVDIAGLAWVEIDSAYDLQKAKKEVLPAIQKRGVTRRQFITNVGAAAVLSIAILSTLISWVSQEPPVFEPDWDTVALAGVEKVKIHNDGKKQSWYRLDASERAAVVVSGPDTVRFESRLLMQDGDPEEVPYSIYVTVGDGAEILLESTARQSSGVEWEDEPVGKRDREMLIIPPGDHKLEAWLDPETSRTSFIRIRQIDEQIDEDV